MEPSPPVPADDSPDSPKRAVVKSSPHARAADPAKYRIMDAVLFPCAGHGNACVLCTTAGKTGRNGRTAAVGATILWLTCPLINHFVARVEYHGGIRAATACLEGCAPATERHVASHAAYEARARELLTPEQLEFFRSHFVQPADPALVKYGNAAVRHPPDLKCLHAQVAQSLGGAPNPLGGAVVNFILLCHALMTAACQGGDDEKEGEPKPAEAAALLTKAQVTAAIQSGELFQSFLTETLAGGKDADCEAVSVPIEVCDGDGAKRPVAVPHVWLDNVDDWKALSPDLCDRSLALTIFLDGKRPSIKRKNRVN